MPALLLNSSLSQLVTTAPPLLSRDVAENVTEKTWQVICAWPVSGQYGPGTRILYYVLVAACVLARKAEWLRNACLAAALILPAVAAIHGVVLAAMHVNGAIDMDIYGAFQLCSIGILAAPVTVRLSSTYFNNPGRNTIFLWTGLILAGLLGLTVEFYRATASPCTQPVSGSDDGYPYADGSMCGLICSVDEGPFSPMRGGSGNNIYVIPEPQKLTFGTATLLAAACCIPAILSMVSMWYKILEINWRSRFGKKDEDGDEPIEGTNGATVGEMKGVNAMIRGFLSVVEIPMFSGAVLAILIVGERNFWSEQVGYQTEPLASVGQWAPIVASGLAACGSLYMLLAEEAVSQRGGDPQICHCECSHHHQSRDGEDAIGAAGTTDMVERVNTRIVHHRSGAGHSHDVTRSASTDSMSSSDRRAHHILHRNSTTMTTSDAGNRRKVARVLTKMGGMFGTASPDRFDDSEFKRGKALDFPEIPGEEHRNRDLMQIREQYNPQRDADGNATPAGDLPGRRSRASSFHGSVASGINIITDMPQAGPSTKKRAYTEGSLLVPQSPSRAPSPTRFHGERPSLETNGRSPRPSTELPSPSSPGAQDNLAVPSIRINTGQNDQNTSFISVPGSPHSPAVVVSSEYRSYETEAGPSKAAGKARDIP